MRNYNPKPPKSQYNPKPKTRMEIFGSQPLEMPKKEEAVKLLKTLRQQTTRRYVALKKSKYYSYANEGLRRGLSELYFERNLPPIEKLKWEQIESEIRVYHQFWASKTSTEAGARDEILRQSNRAFGTNKTGRLNKVFNKEEAKAYWDAYELFYELNEHNSARYSSFRVQRVLGEEFASFYKRGDDFLEFMEEVKKKLESEIDLKKSVTEDEKTVFRTKGGEW